MAGRHVQTYLTEELFVKIKMIAMVENKTLGDILKEAINLVIENRNKEVITVPNQDLKFLLQETINVLKKQLTIVDKE